MLLSAVIALDVSRAISFLKKEAEEAERTAAARHVLGQVVIQVELHLAVSTCAAHRRGHALVLLVSINITVLVDSHLSGIAWSLKQSPRRVLQVQI